MSPARSYGRARRTRTTGNAGAILDAAETLIRGNGFHLATMDELARSAGVSRATLFTRFGSKLGVLEGLNTRCAGSPAIAALVAALAFEPALDRLAHGLAPSAEVLRHPCLL